MNILAQSKLSLVLILNNIKIILLQKLMRKKEERGRGIEMKEESMVNGVHKIYHLYIKKSF